MQSKYAKLFLGFTILSLVAFLVAFTPPGRKSKYKGGKVKDGGSVYGQVVYKGRKAAVVKTSNSVNAQVCGTDIDLKRLVLGKDNGISNSFVYLKGIKKGKKWPAGKYELNQQDCRYQPHMLVMPKGKKLTIKNSDPLLHNVHGYLPNGSTTFNLAMPIKDQTISKKIKKEGLISIECDAGHTWMYSYILSSEHPYAVVTDANGNFSLDDIPPGDYTLAMWHEGWKVKEKDSAGRFVFSDPVEQSKKVTIAAGKTAKINFEVN